MIHPDTHREIARLRHEDLLANAERHRTATALRRLRRIPGGLARERGRSRRAALDGAWEASGSARRG